MTLDSSTPVAEIKSELGDPPRQARTTVQAHILRTIMAALTLVVPVALIIYGQHERVRLERLAADGKQISATVDSRSVHKSRYTLRYRYVVNGASYRGDARVSSDEYHAKAVGSPVAITYLPADPKVNAYGTVQPGDAASAQRNKIILGLVGGALLAMGTWAIQRGIRRDRRLCQLGISVPGIVTQQTTGKHARTHYRYMSVDGQVHQASAQATSASRRVPVGGAFEVLYDPENPATSKPYKGISMARVLTDSPPAA